MDNKGASVTCRSSTELIMAAPTGKRIPIDIFDDEVDCQPPKKKMKSKNERAVIIEKRSRIKSEQTQALIIQVCLTGGEGAVGKQYDGVTGARQLFELLCMPFKDSFVNCFHFVSKLEVGHKPDIEWIRNTAMRVQKQMTSHGTSLEKVMKAVETTFFREGQPDPPQMGQRSNFMGVVTEVMALNTPELPRS